MNAPSKPRVTGTTHALPFAALSAGDFERLTLWLVRREGFERVQHLGEAGSDEGRDLLAWQGGRRFAFQCKRVKAFSSAQGEAEIRKLQSLKAEERPQEVVFVLPIALRAETRKAIWTTWGDEETCHFWVGTELDERVKRHRDLVEEFFQIQAEAVRSAGPEAPSGVTSIPQPPVHYLPRDEALAALRAKLLAPGSTRFGITSPRRAVGVQGMGGIGKSVLAAALAQDEEVQAAFPDGIFWVAVGQQPDLRRLQIELALAAGERQPIVESVHQGKLLLSRLWVGRRVLVVLDDLWSLDHAEAFTLLGSQGRLLVTTRHSDLLVGLGAEEFQVALLAPGAALALLAEWVGEEVENLPAEAVQIARQCGYLPLALAMIGAMIRQRPTAWSDALERLSQADLGKIRRNFPDYPYPDLLRALAVSVEALAPEERERYLELAVFPEEAGIPEATLETLWAASGLSAADSRDLAAKLVARSLAQPAGEGLLRVHDLQADYLRQEVGDLGPLHGRLVDAYFARCSGGFPSGPNDGCYFQNLAYHLVRAGRWGDLRELLLDFAWLVSKLAATGINALLADYDTLPHDPELRLVQGALRLSAHVVSERPEELLGQLLGRLFDREEPGLVAFREKARPLDGSPLLRPLSGGLTTPGSGLVRTLTGDLGRIDALAVLPDGRVVSGSNDKTLRVWETGSGQLVKTLAGHTGAVNALAVLPDGRVVSGSDDTTLRIWDVGLGETVRTLEGHTDWVNSLAVLPEGRVVSGSRDATLRVWDMDLGETVRTFEGHRNGVTALTVLPEGGVVSGSYDGTLKVWDVGTGEAVKTLSGHTDKVTALAVLGDGGVVSGSGDRTLRVWNIGTGEAVRTLKGHSDWVNALAVLEDGRVVSGSRDESLRVWDVGSGETERILEGHTGWIDALAVLPDGRVVSGSGDKTIRIWELDSGAMATSFEGHAGEVTALAVLPDGRVVSGSSDSTFRVWEGVPGKTVKAWEGRARFVTALAGLSDGRVVSGSHGTDLLLVWEVSSGEVVQVLEGHGAWVRALAVVPDGRVVSGAGDATLRVWDVDSGETVKTLRGHTAWVRSLAVLSNDRIVSGSDDTTVRVWDVGSGEVRILAGHAGVVSALAALSDGRVLSGSDDKTLRIWDVGSGETVKTLEGHAGAVTALAVLSDGRVVSASVDSTLRVWDVGSGKMLARFTFDVAAPSALASLDGQSFVAGDVSGRLHYFRFEDPP